MRGFCACVEPCAVAFLSLCIQSLIYFVGDSLIGLRGRRSFLGVFYRRYQLVLWTTFFEFSPLFYIMPTSRYDAVKDVQPRTGEAWAVSCKKRFRANVLVWALPKSFTTLDIRSKFVDIGLDS